MLRPPLINMAHRGNERAREIIRQQQGSEYSLVDAISFALMERMHIRLAWTYDHHFQQFGFTQLQ